MNKDDIINLAREYTVGGLEFDEDGLIRFVELITAVERERLKWDGLHSCHPECDRPACVHTRKAVEAEREACAKLCEQPIDEIQITDDCSEYKYRDNQECADAIRARGQE